MTVINLLDSYTAQHLANWLDRTVHPDDRDAVLSRILSLIEDEPSLLDTHSWSEIRRLAEAR